MLLVSTLVYDYFSDRSVGVDEACVIIDEYLDCSIVNLCAIIIVINSYKF